MTPPHQHRGKQPYREPTAVYMGVGALPHGLVSDDSSGANTVIITPVFLPNTKTNRNDLRKQKRSNKADDATDDTTQPASGQHSNWVPNATTTRYYQG